MIWAPRSFFASSSRFTSTTFWPMIPPAALISSAARSTPFRIETPMPAEPPVYGPYTPTLMSATAGVANSTAVASIASRFISRAPQRSGHRRRKAANPVRRDTGVATVFPPADADFDARRQSQADERDAVLEVLLREAEGKPQARSTAVKKRSAGSTVRRSAGR